MRYWIAGAAVLLALSLRLQAAPTLPSYRLDSWTTANGLPSNTIRVLRQTRDGYLWLATENGLARFDGIRFTIFSKSDTRGITGSRYVALWNRARVICGRVARRRRVAVSRRPLHRLFHEGRTGTQSGQAHR